MRRQNGRRTGGVHFFPAPPALDATQVRGAADCANLRRGGLTQERAMPVPLAVLSLAASLVVAVADPVPELDVAPGCRAAAREPGAVAQRADTCLSDERKARDQLRQEWTQFPAGDRVRCAALARTGPPSYVDLLTCLEIARDAAKLPASETLAPVRRR
jgi:hypothetical protein